jgi:hypothetical protein
MEGINKFLGILVLGLAASTANAAFVVDIYDNAAWGFSTPELNHTIPARAYVDANSATNSYSNETVNFYDYSSSKVVNGFATNYWPHALGNDETFIAHVTGDFYLSVDSYVGSWSDDGIDFLVDSAAYISRPNPHAPTFDLSSVVLLAGWHTLDVVLYERTGAAALQLFAEAITGGARTLLHSPSAVPVPAAALLFAPALIGFMGLRRKIKATIA